MGVPSLLRGRVPLNPFAFSGGLGARACGVAGGCVAQEPAQTQPPATQSSNTQVLNRPVPSTMTCGEIKALLKDDTRTAGTAILWLDGYYSGRSGLTELPAGWVRTVSQGIGGFARSVSTNSVPCLTLSASSIGSMPAEIE